MEDLIVYGRTIPPCSSCANLKTLLATKEIAYEYKDISIPENFDEFCKHRLRTVPAVFENGKHLGGFDKMKELLQGESIEH